MIPDPHVMGIPYYIVKVFIRSKYGIKNMNGKITISLLLISAIFLSGCTFKMNKEITDDDRYLKALNDFSYENQWIWKSGTFQPYIANQTNNYTNPEQKMGASLIIFAKTFNDRVSGLKVSPKFETSKIFFIQTVRRYGAIGEYMQSPYMHLQPETTRSPDEVLATANMNIIWEELKTIVPLVYDSNICQESAGYPSIASVCDNKQF
jgi:hypothetical protein